MGTVPRSGRTVEQVLAEAGTGSRGIVERQDLIDRELTEAEIDWRVRTGLLIVEYPGIYRVGHAAPWLEAEYLAAVWACGKGAYLRGRAAAYIDRLIYKPPARPQVATPTERKIDGIDTRRRKKIHPADFRDLDGLPIASVATTVVELAGECTEDQMGHVVHQADVIHSVTPDHIEAVLQRRKNVKNARMLRAIIHGEMPITLSELERICVGLFDEWGYPPPAMQKKVGKYRVDFHWTEPALTVEVCGYRWHRSRKSWQRDHDRAREAFARGDFRSYTWKDAVEDTRQMRNQLDAIFTPRAVPLA